MDKIIEYKSAEKTSKRVSDLMENADEYVPFAEFNQVKKVSEKRYEDLGKLSIEIEKLRKELK